MDAQGNLNVLDWYWDLPPVTRSMFTASFILTAACALDVITPFTLYYNNSLIWSRGEVSCNASETPAQSYLVFEQVWRLLTNFLFYGQFGIDYIFHMYFCKYLFRRAAAARLSLCTHSQCKLCDLVGNDTRSIQSLHSVRFSSMLEMSSFRRKVADHVWFLLIGAFSFMVRFQLRMVSHTPLFNSSASQCVAPLVQIHFFGSALTFMMVYVWAKRNPHERMAFLGVMNFDAPWLPWVYLGLTFLMGQSIIVDVMGIAVGHAYFFAQDVLPALCAARGWLPRRPLCAPSFLRIMLGEAADDAAGAGRAIHAAPLLE